MSKPTENKPTENKPTHSALRKGLLARVHIAKKELRLDDPTYRLVLERVVGVSSASECTDEQLQQVLAAFRARGWKDRGARRRQRPPVASDREPQMRKIEALLADAKRSWDYAHTLARRIAKVDRVQWATSEGLRGIITALEKDAARRRARAIAALVEVPDAGA